VRLNDLCEEISALPFPDTGAQEQPAREVVIAARQRVAEAVVDDFFLSDCISKELERIRNGLSGSGLDPFVTIPGKGIGLALGYWPPGSTAGPHEHTAWTITAVCRNHLEVTTYDREAAYRENALLTRNRFDAVAGRTGFIYEPCIHEPRNTTPDWSLSFHVSSPRDGERPSDYERPPPFLQTSSDLPTVEAEHPYAAVIARRRQQAFTHQLVRILCSMETSRARGGVLPALGFCSSATRKLVDQAIPGIGGGGASGADWILKRVHEDLVLARSCEESTVSLAVETPNGYREELAMSDVASQAVAFLEKRHVFDLRELPGHLSQNERIEIGLAVEEAGLFRRVWDNDISR
jgi:hypothetical protein